jgi:hypothetical protein
MTFEPREIILDKWLTALESGDYKQGHGRLRTDQGFCCLGVLCEVAGLRARHTITGFDYDASTGVVPGILASHMGMDCDGKFSRGTLAESPTTDCLAAMNDGYNGNKRYTFAEIAAFIRSHHDHLFRWRAPSKSDAPSLLPKSGDDSNGTE